MKKLTTLIFIANLLWFGELNAQFNVDWAYDYMHTNNANFSNEGRKVAADTIGNKIYTLADVTSDLDQNGNVTGLTYSYVILAQFDLSGSLTDEAVINVGNHTANGFDLKSGFGLQVDNAGNVFIAYMNYDATTSYDVNISKFDNQLNLLWNYKFNAPTDDQGIAMQVSDQGNAFAILKSTIAGNVRHRIIKANAAGVSALPLFTYSAQPDYLLDLTVDANQIVYTTGYRLVNGVKTILISSVNSAGTLLWSRVDNCGSVTGDDFSRDIHLGDDDYLYITGSSQGTVQHGIDAVMMKFNPVNGKKIWDSFINFNLTDGGHFIINPDPNYAFVSWVASNTIYIDQISAITGAQIRRISYIPVPVSSFSSLSGITIADMKMSKYQNIYITGGVTGVSAGQNFGACYLIRASFSSRGLPQVQYTFPVTGNPAQSFRGVGIALHDDESQVYFLEDEFDSFASHSQERIWLISLDLPGGLRLQQDQESDANSLSLDSWPNPVNNELNIQTSEAISSVEITDISGKIVLQQNLNGILNVQMDVSGLSGGLYIVKVYDANGFSQMTKMIKASSK